VTAQVHPSAVVEPGAELGQDVSVGAFCVIGSDVRVGAGSNLHSHVVVTGWTALGERCQVHPFAVLGGAPQDRKYHDERSALVLGDEVVVREHATVHCGTAAGQGRTSIGDRTLLMAYTHVAHDCEVGCDVVMTNGATLAGHVVVEDHAVLGGFAAVGQMLRVGASAMLAAGAMVEQDVPPYCTVAGDRAKVRTINVIGLRRRGLDAGRIASIRRAFRTLFRSGRPLADAIREIRENGVDCPEVEHLLSFVEASRKGVCR
jgi:UDP-N-acetylglucosamine acyltransferase